MRITKLWSNNIRKRVMYVLALSNFHFGMAQPRPQLNLRDTSKYHTPNYYYTLMYPPPHNGIREVDGSSMITISFLYLQLHV